LIYSPDLYISSFPCPLIELLFRKVEGLKAKPCYVKKPYDCRESQAQRKATFKANRFTRYSEAIMTFPNYRASSIQIATYLGYNPTSIASNLKAMVKEFPNNFYKCGEYKHQNNGRNSAVWAFKEEEELMVMNEPYVTVNIVMK